MTERAFYILSSIAGALLLIGTISFMAAPTQFAKTHVSIIQAWQHAKPHGPLLYWDRRVTYSALFYSHGDAKITQDLGILETWLQEDFVFYLLLPSVEHFPDMALNACQYVQETRIRQNYFILYRCKGIK